MWSLRRCTKSLLQALRDPFTGSNTTKTSNLSSGWIRLGLQLKKVLGPYVEECLKLLTLSTRVAPKGDYLADRGCRLLATAVITVFK